MLVRKWKNINFVLIGTHFVELDAEEARQLAGSSDEIKSLHQLETATDACHVVFHHLPPISNAEMSISIA